MDYGQTHEFKENETLKFEPLFEFERRTVQAPAKAVLNRSASFLLISEGNGAICINNHLCVLNKGSLVALMPWQLLEFKEVEQDIKYNQIRYNLDIINQMAKTIRDAQGDNRFLEDLYSNHVVQCNELEVNSLTDVFSALKEELI